MHEKSALCTSLMSLETVMCCCLTVFVIIDMLRYSSTLMDELNRDFLLSLCSPAVKCLNVGYSAWNHPVNQFASYSCFCLIDRGMVSFSMTFDLLVVSSVHAKAVLCHS